MNKQEVENWQYSTATLPSEPMLHPVECDRSLTQQPILSVLQPKGTADLRFSVLGNFCMATGGFQASNFPAGELWVTYDISFSKKVQRPLSLSDHFQAVSGTQTVALPMGVKPVLTAQSTFGCTCDGTVITFPNSYSGSVQVEYNLTAAAISGTGGMFAVMSPSITAYPLLNNNTAWNSVGFTATTYSHIVYIHVQQGGTLTLTWTGALGSGYTTGDLVISECAVRS